MSKQLQTPPRIAQWILSVTNRKRNREIVLGDFEELYNKLCYFMSVEFILSIICESGCKIK